MTLRRDPFRHRVPALTVALLLLLASTTGSIGAPSGPGSGLRQAARPAIAAEVPGVAGDDACALLSDDEVLRATGARSVLGRTPGGQMRLPAGCFWQLEPIEPGFDPWELHLGIQVQGGRQRYAQESAPFAKERLAGLGDDATELFGAWRAVKGDAYVGVQYVAFGGGSIHPARDIGRTLTWLVMQRVPGGEPGASPSPGPSQRPVGAARRLVARLRSADFGQDTIDAAVELLARSGIATYARPTDAQPLVPVTEPASPMELLLDQVRAMALEAWAGAGLAGANLDSLVATAADLATPSEIVAGYIAAVDSEGAAIARELMGEPDWARSTELVIPQLALVLFVSDVARERQADTSAAVRRVPTLAAQLAIAGDAAIAQAGICSQVSTFITGALSRVFDALKLSAPGGGAGRIVVSIWNFVITIAEGTAREIVRQLTQRVLDVIAQVAGAVGLAATIVSAIRPWTVSVTAEPPVTAKGVGGSPGQAGQIVGRVDLGGLDDWPAAIKDCAQAANRPLPNLKPEGARVTWDPIAQSPPDLLAEGGHEARLDARGIARLDFTTLVDDLPEPWQDLPGRIFASVTIERPQLEQLRQIAIDQLLGQLPEVARGALEPFVRPLLDALGRQLDRLVSTGGSGFASVIYHVPAETPEPPATPRPTAPPRAVWVHLDRAASPPALAGRVVELVACSGPYGQWDGVLRLAGLDAGDGFTVPFAELPLSFGFRGSRGYQATRTTTSGEVPTAVPDLTFQASFELFIGVDGRMMTISGTGQVEGPTVEIARVLAERSGALELPIEPAPAGICPG